jgi:hypothetical protein
MSAHNLVPVCRSYRRHCNAGPLSPARAKSAQRYPILSYPDQSMQQASPRCTRRISCRRQVEQLAGSLHTADWATPIPSYLRYEWYSWPTVAIPALERAYLEIPRRSRGLSQRGCAKRLGQGGLCLSWPGGCTRYTRVSDRRLTGMRRPTAAEWGDTEYGEIASG